MLRAVAVARMDHHRADFDESVAVLRAEASRFGVEDYLAHAPSYRPRARLRQATRWRTCLRVTARHRPVGIT